MREAVPGVNNLLAQLRDAAAPPRRAARRVWPRPGQAAAPLPLDGRVVELPVVYGGDGGPHMADVVAHTGLAVEEIVAIHSAPVYPVYALGSHPGYCYLGGMDPRIATPRRKVPVHPHPRRRRLDRRRADRRLRLGRAERLEHDRHHRDALLRRDARPAGAAPARRQHRLPRRRDDPMIEILSQSALATVQDLGRFGGAALGRRHRRRHGPAGARLRQPAARQRRRRRRRSRRQVFPFEVRFDADCAFALTGADCAATLDGVPLLPWSAARRGPGQVLRLGLPQAGRWRGARAYLCLARRHRRARWCSARAARSSAARSAASKGARCARATGCAPARRARRAAVGWTSASSRRRSRCRSRSTACPPCGCCRRPSTTASPRPRATRFWAEPWKITPQSDRYGFRLAGPSLEPMAPMEMRSHGIVPGVIQVPHGGQPIVQMCDAQPSGGYPKIGTVIEADLWRLGQAPIGSRVRFVETDWDERARGRATRLADWLAEVRRLLDLYRTRSACPMTDAARSRCGDRGRGSRRPTSTAWS